MMICENEHPFKRAMLADTRREVNSGPELWLARRSFNLRKVAIRAFAGMSYAQLLRPSCAAAPLIYAPPRAPLGQLPAPAR